MAFGRENRETKRFLPTSPGAHDVTMWARDAALLPYFQATPPHRDAAPGSPEAAWRGKLRVTLPDGQGEQWIDVPAGSTIEKTGTDADPTFRVIRRTEA